MSIHVDDPLPGVVKAGNRCVHHWLIDTIATGGSFHARCKRCGMERDFSSGQLEPRKGLVLGHAPAPPATRTA